MQEKDLLLEKINDAEYVLIGIGEEFNENFERIDEYPEIIKKLDSIQENDEAKWMIPFLEKDYLDNQVSSKNINALNNLAKLVENKNYFVVTTCIDGNIIKAGFDPEKTVEPCGGYHKLQCSQKCSTKIYDVTDYIEDINKGIQPICPDCGKPLVLNNIICENYVEEGYLEKWDIYTKWLQKTLNRKLCVIELGVGLHLPSVIKWPFEKVAFFNQKASFFRINEALPEINEDLKNKGVSIQKNAVDFLDNL